MSMKRLAEDRVKGGRSSTEKDMAMERGILREGIPHKINTFGGHSLQPVSSNGRGGWWCWQRCSVFPGISYYWRVNTTLSR